MANTNDSAEIIVAYTGDGVNNSEIIAGASVAFGRLMTECDKALSKKIGTKSSIAVTADYNAEIIVMKFRRKPKAYMGTVLDGDIVPVDELVEHIFSLAHFLHWLRGRKIDKVKDNNNGTVGVNVGHDYIIINRTAMKLYSSASVRENLEKVLAPLECEGIDRFELRDDNEPDTAIDVIHKDELPYFYANASEAKSSATTNEDVLAKILEIDFVESKFTLQRGDEKIHAVVKDKDFAEKMQTGSVSFISGDSLDAMLETSEIVHNGETKKVYCIPQVYGIVRRPNNA